MAEWNDGRLDDLGERVDRIETKMEAGFARLDKKMDDGFARLDSKFDAKFDEFFTRMDAKFDLVNDRFDNLYRMLFRAAWTLAIGLLGLVGVIAARL